MDCATDIFLEGLYEKYLVSHVFNGWLETVTSVCIKQEERQQPEIIKNKKY